MKMEWTRRHLLSELADARGDEQPLRTMQRDDMDVVYQPIVDLANRHVVAYEALARCRWSNLENPPDLFRAAVRQGCCGYLGRLIREVAFERARGWPLYINLHPEELASRWLVRPDDPLGFHDAEVYLEVTEVEAFQYKHLTVGALKEVCTRTGAHIVLDDFGAGHSNLNRLIDIEPDVVKLDRHVISGVDRDKKKQSIVRATARLCRDLGAQLIAEGVETRDELSALMDCSINRAQGFLFGRPTQTLQRPIWPMGCEPDVSSTPSRHDSDYPELPSPRCLAAK